VIIEIHAALRRFIVENFLLGDDAGLTNSESLLQTGVIDSTGILEVVGFIEDTYAISITDEEMLPKNLETIDNIAAFVQRKLAAAVGVPVPGTPALTTPVAARQP
jgi:acyl carrier protein